jgi:proteic killer suppression protein
LNSTSELDLVPSIARIDNCYVTGYDSSVRIRNFAHKGLRRLYEEDDLKGVPAASVDKLRKMFAFLDAMEDAAELRSIPAWRPHLLTGDRKGAWSLHVTRNWRMTFSIDAAENEICDVTLED